MISRQLEAEILRLYRREHWAGRHPRPSAHDTVRRVLTQAGIPAAAQSTRGSIAEPFVPTIRDTPVRCPSLRASRLHDRVRERRAPRHRSALRASPPIPVTLLDEPRVRDLAVRLYAVAEYENSPTRAPMNARIRPDPEAEPASPDDNSDKRRRQRPLRPRN